MYIYICFRECTGILLLHEPPEILRQPSVWFLVDLGGNAARFFLGVFSGDFPSYFGVSFKVLSVLGFSGKGFLQWTLSWESGVFGEVFWALKCLFFAPQKRRAKNSPFLSLCFGVLFLLRGVFGEVLGQEPRVVFWKCSWLFSGARFCRVFVYAAGSLPRRFWVPVFFSARLSLPPSSPSPPSLLGAGPGAPFLFLVLAWQDLVVVRGQVRLSMFFSLSPLLCSLCPGRPPSPLSPPLPLLFLSLLSLSLSLACKR